MGFQTTPDDPVAAQMLCCSQVCLIEQPWSGTRTWRPSSIAPRPSEEKNMLKQILTCTALVMMAMVNPVNAQQSPPTSEKSKQIEALVNRAAALIESKGKAVFSEFRKKDTEWFSGDTYLFVYDLKSNVLLNAAFPAREGTNTTGQKDANGKLFHHAFIEVAESKGSGWVDYMFPKPGQTEPSRKWAYVKAVKVDGVPSLVASGFYPE
jgi:cytochrome c